MILVDNIRNGRFKTGMTDEAAEYTSSFDADKLLFEADIKTNFAHTSMLKHEGIIDSDIADNILCALDSLKEEGFDALVFDPSVEDVHMAIENYVTSKIGPQAGFMHTAKSRNDQVATDIRLVLRERIIGIQIGILEFMEGIVEMAGEHLNDVFIGFTHLQHAQPITIAHHLMAHVQALKRDYERLEDTYKRVNLNPLGSAAMATTSFPINRELTTKLLGFDSYLENSMDGVSARDFVAETVFDLTALCTTLSKICEELILWSTYEFGVIDMADEYSSTSSIMPQKKNPDVAELARGKSTIVNGELVTILTILKAIPYTYNRDLQEITPHLWNALKVTEDTLSIVTRMLLSVKFNTERCAELAGRNFATATDLADIMVREKQVPFRTAHKIVGRIVNEATSNNMVEEDITSDFIDDIAVDLGFDKLYLDDELIQKALNPTENVKIRRVVGGPAPEMVDLARDNIKVFLNEEFEKKGI
ncbi:argininosuccinate lyase ArgH [Methanobrevibacter millerae]|uniref:Argininosuccinate lyase n=1 Tax=Methanobrevibacter millerae TaxID=230361 RepID=A0A0U2SI56_9EURY|nr:argininosuccinate lyase ArgH [Methanobrevibacter millerae]